MKKQKRQKPKKNLREIYQNAAIALTIQFEVDQARKTDGGPQSPRIEPAADP